MGPTERLCVHTLAPRTHTAVMQLRLLLRLLLVVVVVVVVAAPAVAVRLARQCGFGRPSRLSGLWVTRRRPRLLLLGRWSAVGSACAHARHACAFVHAVLSRPFRRCARCARMPPLQPAAYAFVCVCVCLCLCLCLCVSVYLCVCVRACVYVNGFSPCLQVKLLRELVHVNIVRLVDVFVDHDTASLALVFDAGVCVCVCVCFDLI